MINSYTITEQQVDVNQDLVFAIDKIKTGCTVTHVPGSTTFSFNKPGFYMVTVNAVASAIAAATDPITLEAYVNGIVVPGALTSELSADADTPVALGFTTIIQVRPNCPYVDNETNLTFRNTGVEANYTNATATITKLC